jgi:hypothetical protein
LAKEKSYIKNAPNLHHKNVLQYMLPSTKPIITIIKSRERQVDIALRSIAQ